MKLARIDDKIFHMEILGNTFYFGWEVSLMVWLQAHLGGIGVKLAALFTTFGEPMILILILGLFYWGIDKKYGKYIFVNLFAVILWAPILKNIVLRRRPYFDHPDVNCLRPVEAGDVNDISIQGYSFPSIHSANAITVYGRVGQYTKSLVLKIIAWIIPFLVGVSRFVLGVHYPTDVLCGWAFGLLVMLIIDLLLKYLKQQEWIYVILLVTALPGFFICTSADFYSAYGLALGGLIGFWFEKRFVNFPPAKNFLFVLLRLLGGAAIFIGIDTLLKLPFPKDLLQSATTTAFLIRTGRYAIASFLMLGIYPLVFRKTNA